MPLPSDLLQDPDFFPEYCLTDKLTVVLRKEYTGEIYENSLCAYEAEPSMDDDYEYYNFNNFG